MTNDKKFNALTPQQKEKFKILKLQNPRMSFDDVLSLTKKTKYISKAQRAAFERIVHINRLQKPELIEIGIKISEQAVLIAKENGRSIDEIPEIVAEIIERAHFGLFQRMFVQSELQGVTLHTLYALCEKGILVESKPYEDGAVYWKLTGREL